VSGNFWLFRSLYNQAGNFQTERIFMSTQLDLSPLKNALTRLREALEFCNSDIAKGNPRFARFLQGGAIQAFEYSYSLTIKFLQRYLQQHEAEPGEVDRLSFNDLVRRGYETGLLAAELVVWKQFRHNRNLSSHAYDENKAREVYKGIPAFLTQAELFYAEVEKRQNAEKES